MTSLPSQVVLLLLAGLGLVYYVGLWREKLVLHGPSGIYGNTDAVVAGVLSVWFASIIAQSAGATLTITVSGILASGLIYAGIVGMLVTLLSLRGVSLTQAFGLRWTRWREDLAWLGLAFLAVLPIVFCAQWLVSLTVVPEEQNQPLLEFWMKSPDVLPRILVAVMAVVFAPLAEEFIFRGYLYGVAKQFVGPLWAGLAASLLFAAIHVHLPAFAGLFLLALALTLVYEISGSIWAPVLMHALFNGLSLVASLFWPQLPS
jgi:membrane protease YdiL (CAAX protease family)